MGLEPTTPGTTIQCSIQLSYTHHLLQKERKVDFRLGRAVNRPRAGHLDRG